MITMDLTKKISNNSIKSCVDCKTTKTPLWRGGPAGPKSLCNACGIKHRKRRRAAMAPNKAPENKKKDGKPHISSTTASDAAAANDGSSELNDSFKRSLMALGKDFYLQRLMASSVVKKQRWQRRRKLCEEELAAVSLLAMSCSSVYA